LKYAHTYIVDTDKSVGIQVLDLKYLTPYLFGGGKIKQMSLLSPYSNDIKNPFRVRRQVALIDAMPTVVSCLEVRGALEYNSFKHFAKWDVLILQ
jgi:hypothetical protein